eukprot:GHVL01016252.1.p2 GENE.GHVL01016252.1~~GHVL01016252.1.p2  ORF type:complete len:353 (+),score=100.93 GHVL01016252.1:55-1113(+)
MANSKKSKKNSKIEEEMDIFDQPIKPLTKNMLLDLSRPWYEIAEENKLGLVGETDNILLNKFKNRANIIMETWSNQLEDMLNKDNDQRWMRKTATTGTLADRVSALTLITQACPILNYRYIRSLFQMCAKKSRQESSLAIEALKDLALNNLLPDRKLNFFQKQPINENTKNKISDKILLFWLFEHQLKVTYAGYVQLLIDSTEDVMKFYKEKCINSIAHLLTAKPEQEQALMTALVSVLGDKSAKVASNASYLLNELKNNHPQMTSIIINEIGSYILKNNTSHISRCRATLFLSEIIIYKNDIKLPLELFFLYLQIFKIHTSSDDKKEDIKKIKKKKKKKKYKKNKKYFKNR